jgi:hypothetical protein
VVLVPWLSSPGAPLGLLLLGILFSRTLLVRVFAYGCLSCSIRLSGEIRFLGWAASGKVTGLPTVITFVIPSSFFFLHSILASRLPGSIEFHRYWVGH